MGTKFEYAIDLLANSPLRRGKTIAFFWQNCVNDQETSGSRRLRAEDRGICKSQERERLGGDPMDRKEETQNIESIKKTMQIHEEIFKQQVRELHRLYNVQTMLMAEAKKQIDQNRILGPTTTTATNSSVDWHSQAFPSKNFDLERPSKGDVSSDTRNLNDGCSVDDEHEVELTLSIGGKVSKKKRRIEGGMKLVPSLSIESNRSVPPDNSGSTETSDRERKRPHWLFQV